MNKLIDGEERSLTKPEEIADKLRDFFGNIAPKLKEKSRPESACNHTDYLEKSIENSLVLFHATPSEISNIIRALKNKSTLDTRISPLKLASECAGFNNAIAKVVNSSFDQGLFPSALKLARVVPIHKGGSKTEVSNYRPISLLSSMSKIYEKLMHRRITDFMTKTGSLYEQQYGFREGRSCEHALLNAKQAICNSLGKKQVALLILIDFSKAFDMIEFDILLHKLWHYGIRGNAHDWMKSYLTDRQQFVTVSGKDSSKTELKYGVPQGSILGPLLFIIYVNDMPNLFKQAKFIMYADDANIIITGESVSEVSEIARDLGCKLVKWVNANGLALNLKKTNYMLFSRSKMKDIALKINNVEIERKREARFLGVIIDDQLTWGKHISCLKLKMARYVGIMYKLKKKLPLKARVQVFHSFVQSHLNYCSNIWGFAAKSHIESLFSAQKKGIRAIIPGFALSHYKDGNLPTGTKVYFRNLEILTVHGIIAKNALLLIDKVSRVGMNIIPSSITKLFDDSPLIRSCNQNDELLLKNWHEKYGTYAKLTNSIFYRGPLAYNYMSDNYNLGLESIISHRCYKTNMKKELFKIQNQGPAEEWEPCNNFLTCIGGIRKSARIQNYKSTNI